MRPASPIRAALVIAAAVLAVGVGSAAPAAPSWTRISGPNNAGDQLGLARTPDGTLHVIWNRGNQAPSSIFDTRVSASGASRGTTTVTGHWEGARNGLVLLVMPDKTLRLVATGDHSSPGSNGGISTFTAPASGASWTLQPEVWGGPIAAASSVIGATLTKDGQLVTGWRGTAAVGIPPSSIPQTAYAPFQLATHLATDAGSGAVVLAGVYGGGKGGVYVQQVLPSTGKAVVLSDGGNNNDYVEGLSARIGAPGVYVAYADTKAVHLYRYGGSSKTLARGPFTSATACAGPDGRLWVAWGDNNNELFITRSNRAVGGYEPVQKLRLPQQTRNGLRFLQCEGSAGPADLFAEVLDKANGLGFWRTHVLALFSLQARAAARPKNAATARVTISARDAGDPVPGATISVGGRRLKTDASGTVLLTLKPGTHPVSGAAAGYATASVKVTVR
ncbi:MAG: hypothetical protein ACM3QU_13100 [Verrucomicrobiota bacterium]